MSGPRRRPRNSGGAPHRIAVRLTEHEYVAIRHAACASGRRVSVARFVAEAAIIAAGAAPPPAPPRRAPSRLVLAEVADAVAAVNRVGNNLNQLAREKNATGLRPVGSLETERRALAALDRLAHVAERAAGTA